MQGAYIKVTNGTILLSRSSSDPCLIYIPLPSQNATGVIRKKTSDRIVFRLDAGNTVTFMGLMLHAGSLHQGYKRERVCCFSSSDPCLIYPAVIYTRRAWQVRFYKVPPKSERDWSADRVVFRLDAGNTGTFMGLMPHAESLHQGYELWRRRD